MKAASSPLCNPQDHQWSRRKMLGSLAAGAGGLAGLLHPAVAETLAKREKQVLFIWLDGGISQFESWDPKPGTRFGGPFRSIPTSVPGTHFCELMPRTARLAHLLSVVRNITTKDNAHSSGVPRTAAVEYHLTRFRATSSFRASIATVGGKPLSWRQIS